MSPKKNLRYHIIYKITRNDGRYYIGRHSTMSLDDGYFGSGKIVTRSVKKHGSAAHVFEIIERCENYETLKKREREIVNEKTLSDPLCMNLKLGGDGGWDHMHRNKIHQSKAGKIGGKIGGKRNNAAEIGRVFGPINLRRYNETAGKEKRVAQALKSAATQRKNGTTLKGRVYMHNEAEQRVVKADDVAALLTAGFVMGKRKRTVLDHV